LAEKAKTHRVVVPNDDDDDDDDDEHITAVARNISLDFHLTAAANETPDFGIRNLHEHNE
jgi:hypothetical protein